MTQSNDRSQSDLIERIDDYLANPPSFLCFDSEVETMFHSQSIETRARHAYWAGLISLLALNLLTLANVFGHEMMAAIETRSLVITHLTSTIPALGLLHIIRRSRDSRLIDLAMASGYVLVMVGALVLNRSMTPEARLFDAFTMVLIPVACNIALPMSFHVAALTSLLVAAAFSVNILSHDEFSRSARLSLILVFYAAAILTLVANYRFEFASRANFLMLLRENRRNADVVRDNLELAAASRTDFLTGLANRRDFDARFAAAVEACRLDGRPVTALLADVDHFKRFNDRLGHLEGDRCLQVVAEAISQAIEGGLGFVGRFGGEEFAVALPGMSIDRASAVVERMRANIAARKIAHPALGEDRILTISVGAASMNPAFPECATSLLSRADAALYRAKRAGRDRAEVDLRIVNG